jgi:hypothetical protein
MWRGVLVKRARAIAACACQHAATRSPSPPLLDIFIARRFHYFAAPSPCPPSLPLHAGAALSAAASRRHFRLSASPRPPLCAACRFSFRRHQSFVFAAPRLSSAYHAHAMRAQ